MKRNLMEFKGQELNTAKIEKVKGGISLLEKIQRFRAAQNNQSNTGIDFVQPNSNGVILAGW